MRAVVAIATRLKIGLAILTGAVVLLPASVFAREGPIHASIKPGHGPVDYWAWNWLNAWYANTEDGNGLYALMSDFKTTYRSTFPSWTPEWVIVYAWSAWRNNANNLKRPLRHDTWLPPIYQRGGAWPVTLLSDECIFAHTDLSPYCNYPAFINVTRLQSGAFQVIVRSRNECNQGIIFLTPEQFAALRAALYDEKA